MRDDTNPDDPNLASGYRGESAYALRKAMQVIETVSIAQTVRAKLLIQISDRYACLAAIEKGLPGWPAIKDQE
jgi:hypothetical protein